MPYDPTIYLGSAAHYRYGRPAYSPELEAVLTQETGLDGNGRLLDVGCGPGVLTIRLAHLFTQAVGLDPDAAEGIFWDWPGDTEVVIARKPGMVGREI